MTGSRPPLELRTKNQTKESWEPLAAAPALLGFQWASHLCGAGRVVGGRARARGQEDEQQAPPVFHRCLGERSPPSLSGGFPPRTPLPADSAGRARRRGPGRRTLLALNLLLAHAQPAPRTPSSSPARARLKLLPVDLCWEKPLSSPPPPFCTQRALQPSPHPVPPSLSCLPVWSGTCLQVKQYLRVLYIQPLL